VNSCQRCGLDNHDGELVCSRCGTELDDAAARALIGEVVLGTYEITDVLGRGGMSVVYRARHKMTDQRVALKILPPELAIHASLKTRFLDEAKALARLEHPNIVRLYNFGEEAGRFVLAMEFVEGQTFEKMIFMQGKVPWQTVTKIGIEVCKALEYAHDKGVVHRDIKPSNVLVRADGTATVMDFGIAKMTESTRLTATGQTMGTVRYMSPEQVRGQTVDHRTDLYSLGVALFEGLAGDTPFQGDTHFDIMSKHLNEPPPSIRAIVPVVPEALERVIHKSLGKGREDRFQSAADFRGALERVADGPSVAGAIGPSTRAVSTIADKLEPALVEDVIEPAPPRRRTGLWLGLAAAVAAAGVGVIVLVARSGKAPADQASGTQGQGHPAGAAKAADGAAPVEPAWHEPPVLPGVTPATDKKFDAPDDVRVISVRSLDADKLAKSYVAARARFVDFAARRGAGAPVESHPLNLYVVPKATMCDPALYAPDAPLGNCASLGFYYAPQSRTLFVPDDADLERLNLPEGAAVHLCRTTRSLHEKGCGKTLLNPYFDAIEHSPSPK
jgi:serine/threonine-protein kinase